MEKRRARGIENYHILSITMPKTIDIASRKKYSGFFSNLYFTKIAVQELSKTVFEIVLAFPEAEIW